MARNYIKIAQAYEDDILSGAIPACVQVKQAINRQRADLKRFKGKRSKYRFDAAAAIRVCKFAELFRHVKGPLAGMPIILDAYQVWHLTTLFGWLGKDGNRRFRRSYYEVPRGNAKSFIESVIALYGLAADNEGGPEIYSAAKGKDQARIVFDDARAMARACPDFLVKWGVTVEKHAIFIEGANAVFKPLASESGSLDGKNIHFAIIDELHAHKTRDVYDVIETGTGKRDNSLLCVITTAGVDLAGICYEIRSYLVKVLAGLVEDDTQFGIIYTIDADDDWQDEATLIKANPGWGTSVRPDVVLALHKKAKEVSSATNNFLTKHLNIWVNAANAFIDKVKLLSCVDQSLCFDDFVGEPCIMALDLASKRDITSAAYLFPRQDENGHWHFFAFVRNYLPSAAIETSTNSQYSGWVKDEHLISTPGNVTDYAFIEEDILAALSNFEVEELAFDPFQATYLINRLGDLKVDGHDQGFNLIEYRSSVANFSEPMKELDAIIVDGRFHYDGCPALTWMFHNLVAKVDAKDNVYPRKDNEAAKIDGVVALIMALGRWLAREEEGPDSYIESAEVLVI